MMSVCGSLVYMYRVRAVAESCTSILGRAGASISMPMIVAIISAVFMLVFAVPM